MAKRFRRLKVAASVVGAFAAFVYLNNSSLLADPLADRPYLIAHRALGQGFSKDGLTGQTCTAARMIPAGHQYLENTIPAMEAAFEYGADAVELDVHPTTDGRFAVFHDWIVDCRTEGSGVTREHSLAELQQLDIGHGYTADGGRTWPFRGRGVGMMPSLDQVLTRFPEGNFLIDVKGNDAEEGARLAEYLSGMIPKRSGEISAFSGPRAVRKISEQLPSVRTMTRPRLKRCLTRYLALGWTGHVPAACRDGVLYVPANVAPWTWGWPNRLLQRMDGVGTRVVLIGDYGGEGFSQGFDDPARVAKLPDDYSGGIWTDRIDLIGPAVDRRWRREQ